MMRVYPFREGMGYWLEGVSYKLVLWIHVKEGEGARCGFLPVRGGGFLPVRGGQGVSFYVRGGGVPTCSLRSRSAGVSVHMERSLFSGPAFFLKVLAARPRPMCCNSGGSSVIHVSLATTSGASCGHGDNRHADYFLYNCCYLSPCTSTFCCGIQIPRLGDLD